MLLSNQSKKSRLQIRPYLMISAMPMIPLRGVRISWLMLARNSLLSRVASSDVRRVGNDKVKTSLVTPDRRQPVPGKIEDPGLS